MSVANSYHRRSQTLFGIIITICGTVIITKNNVFGQSVPSCGTAEMHVTNLTVSSFCNPVIGTIEKITTMEWCNGSASNVNLTGTMEVDFESQIGQITILPSVIDDDGSLYASESYTLTYGQATVSLVLTGCDFSLSFLIKSNGSLVIGGGSPSEPAVTCDMYTVVTLAPGVPAFADLSFSNCQEIV